ncbi:MAG: hypothetical protein ABIJ22_03650 [Patescibacteria group bacterium]
MRRFVKIAGIIFIMLVIFISFVFAKVTSFYSYSLIDEYKLGGVDESTSILGFEISSEGNYIMYASRKTITGREPASIYRYNVVTEEINHIPYEPTITSSYNPIVPGIDNNFFIIAPPDDINNVLEDGTMETIKIAGSVSDRKQFETLSSRYPVVADPIKVSKVEVNDGSHQTYYVYDTKNVQRIALHVLNKKAIPYTPDLISIKPIENKRILVEENTYAKFFPLGCVDQCPTRTVISSNTATYKLEGRGYQPGTGRYHAFDNRVVWLNFHRLYLFP